MPQDPTTTPDDTTSLGTTTHRQRPDIDLLRRLRRRESHHGISVSSEAFGGNLTFLERPDGHPDKRDSVNGCPVRAYLLGFLLFVVAPGR